ncbi:Ferric reductase transmembrane component-like domain [Dillenia turbinata]|uniref:Ferric reductase transmembrane component-like domain n=1 Tax=Dillenia turbinata TaxID=194707 RepID=A0AAN8VNG1_9MAGN
MRERGEEECAPANDSSFLGAGRRSPNSEIRVDIEEDSATVNATIKDSESSGSDARVVSLWVIYKVSQKLKRLATFSRHPPPSPTHYDRTRYAVAHALRGLKFISQERDADNGWCNVEKRFDQLTKSTNGLLPCSRFSECIGMADSKEFGEVLFQALAKKQGINGDTIDKEQLKEFWQDIWDEESRLQTFFNMIDKDADGKVTRKEVREIISLSASANKLRHIYKEADEYAKLIMEELDLKRQGYILVHDLKALLMQTSDASHGENGRNLSQMLSNKLKAATLVKNPITSAKYFIEDNWKKIWIILVWITVMAGLFSYKFTEFRHNDAYQVMGYCLCIAKGAAETLKLNMALVLLPVCRNTMTWLRNGSELSHIIPFDHNLKFHQIIAMGIVVGVGLHALSHLACDYPRLIHARRDKYAPLGPFFGRQPSNYWYFLGQVENVTGILMVALMAVAISLAMPCLRRNRLKIPKPFDKLTGFNAFWYSHHLFVLVYALLIVHGVCLYLTKEWYQKTTWMYLVFPMILYSGERLIRLLRSHIKPVHILKVDTDQVGVVVLHFSKPDGYNYRSGQYMFLNCDAVSPFEWHPFSITSAPADDYLSVHIRTVGDWTNQLKIVFSKEKVKESLPRLLIDGPYGAPAQDYKQYKVVLLVGLGIGATPMISIVKDIANNLKVIEEEEEEEEKDCSFMTRRAYFYWVTKEPSSFEWFKGVMNEVAKLNEKGVVELHNYCTSVHEEHDARSCFIAMLQSINHMKKGIDIVSGTCVKSHFAKPNWQEVYERIAQRHPNALVALAPDEIPAAFVDLSSASLLERRVCKLISKSNLWSNICNDIHEEIDGENIAEH